MWNLLEIVWGGVKDFFKPTSDANVANRRLFLTQVVSAGGTTVLKGSRLSSAEEIDLTSVKQHITNILYAAQTLEDGCDTYQSVMHGLTPEQCFRINSDTFLGPALELANSSRNSWTESAEELKRLFPGGLSVGLDLFMQGQFFQYAGCIRDTGKKEITLAALESLLQERPKKDIRQLAVTHATKIHEGLKTWSSLPSSLSPEEKQKAFELIKESIADSSELDSQKIVRILEDNAKLEAEIRKEQMNPPLNRYSPDIGRDYFNKFFHLKMHLDVTSHEVVHSN